MKVKIGKYKNWFGPYQLAEKLCFWAKKEKDEYGFPRTPDWVHNFGEWLAHGSVESKEEKRKAHPFGGKERPHTWLYKLLSWIDSKRQRQIDVHIDRWDTWGMYHTLAVIILPMLKQLKEEKHGHPWVDDEDVPEHLRSSNAPPKENEYDWDDLSEARWDWVMDEMIWAFEQILDDDAENQFHTGEMDKVMIPLDKDHNEVPEDDKETEIKYWRWDDGPNDTSHYDKEGHQAWGKRVQNGTTLFGKYFQSLWD